MSGFDKSIKKRRLIIVISTLLIPLVLIKYTNFVYSLFIGSFFDSERLVTWQLPLGISFITFTLIAYVLDVFSGRYHLERNLMNLSGLVLFFPHLIAGPILRPKELLPQLISPKPKEKIALLFGITLFSIGLFKKLVLADPIAEVVDRVFESNDILLSRLDYILAVYGFSIQIYCDFSGYTDMAIGIAILLGVNLPKNFQKPYFSTSIVDFWSMWHITLSTWLRDYLYIPLGGNRNGYFRQTLNIFITMSLGGLWHGANLTFFVWGIAHAFGIGLVHTTRKFKILSWISCLPNILKIFITFHFVTACWVFFRSPDLKTVWRVFNGLFCAQIGNIEFFVTQNIFILCLIVVFFISHKWDDYSIIRSKVNLLPKKVTYLPISYNLWKTNE